MNSGRGRAAVKRVTIRVQAGAAGGLAAALVVAGLFFLEGVIRLRPFSIPAELASGLFGGGSASSGATTGVSSYMVVPVEIIAYTGVHLMAFAAIGAGAAFIVGGARYWTSVLGGVAYASVACTGTLYLVGHLAGTPVAFDVLGLPRVLLANALAGAIIGTAVYLGEQSYRRELEA